MWILCAGPKPVQVGSRTRRETTPKTYDALLELPGIGPYTAAAVASISHNQPVACVDETSAESSQDFVQST